MKKLLERAQEVFRPTVLTVDPEFETLRAGRIRHLFVAQSAAERALRLGPSASSEVDLLMQAMAAKKAGQETVAQAVEHTFDLVEPAGSDNAPTTPTSIGDNPMAQAARAKIDNIPDFPLPGTLPNPEQKYATYS